jgi:hypothetical protein
MNKIKIKIKTTGEEVEYEFDLDEMAEKSMRKKLSNDDFQILFNYLLNKK